MPERKTIEKARQDKRQGKAPTTQAGEFIKEEIEHIRKGKHGARSPKQAIAIGLSKARKAGVKLPPPPSKKAKKGTGTKSRTSSESSPRRSQATLRALKKEPTSSVSSEKLARQAHESALKRGPAKRKAAAQKAVRTKGSATLHRAAKKAAHTRKRRAGRNSTATLSA